MTAPLKRLLSIGSQKNSRKTPAMIAKGFQMLFQSTRLAGSSLTSVALFMAIAPSFGTSKSSMGYSFPHVLNRNSNFMAFGSGFKKLYAKKAISFGKKLFPAQFCAV
jgi:hypothetical protein